METEQSLRRRIKTVSDLYAIVRTLKALAAASARQCDGALQALNEYARTLDMGLQVALRGKDFGRSEHRQTPNRLAAVIFGSDVGLCGRFNEDLVDLALDKMNGFQVPIAGRSVLAVGARIEARLTSAGHPVETVLLTPGSAAAVTATVRHILGKIDAWQAQGIQQVLLFYSQAGAPRLLHLLPVDLHQFSRLAQEPWPSKVLPCYSLEAERLLAALIRQHLFVCLFRACAESLASEHLMRLRTTQAAEKNIAEKLEALQAEFRIRRQENIDAELLDIGAGFQAVGGDNQTPG